MAEELRQQVLDYLKNHNTMTLARAAATRHGGHGVLRQRRLETVFFFLAESRHCQNFATNARVAVTVQEDYKDWRVIKGIQLEAELS
jgi:uncharacterized protein YhbP (UPF0306 family)